MSANELLFGKSRDRIVETLERFLSKGTLLQTQKDGIKKFLKTSKSYNDFAENIPILDKNDIFKDKALLANILKNRESFKIIPSAGTSGSLLSFRLANPEFDEKPFLRFIDLIENVWKIKMIDSIVLNCYPTGIYMPTNYRSIEISTKMEVLNLALDLSSRMGLNKILIGQPHFITEFANNHPEYLKDNQGMHFVTGGCWYPKTFLKILGNTGDDDKIISLFGAAELGLGIGTLSPDLAKIRKALNKESINRLNVTATTSCPMIFYLNQDFYFLESIEGRLIVTTLTNNDVPAIRYDIGDIGELFTYDQCQEIFSDDILPDQYIFSLENKKPDNYLEYPIDAGEVEEYLFDQPELFKEISPFYKITKEKLVFFKKNTRKLSSVTSDYLYEIFNTQLGVKLEFIDIPSMPHQFDLMRKPKRYF